MKVLYRVCRRLVPFLSVASSTFVVRSTTKFKCVATEWQEFSKSTNRPRNIPSNPQVTYKNKGWSSIGDWLGTGSVAPQKMVFRDFKEIKKYVQNIGIKNQKEWMNHCKSIEKPNDIPTAVNTVYKGMGWINWVDFLGKDLEK